MGTVDVVKEKLSYTFVESIHALCGCRLETMLRVCYSYCSWKLGLCSFTQYVTLCA